MDLARVQEVNLAQQNRMDWLPDQYSTKQQTNPEEPMERNKSLDLIARSNE